MPTVELSHELDFEGWRTAARVFRAEGVAPDRVRFVIKGADDGRDLFDRKGESPTPVIAPFPVPRAFVDLAGSVIQHRSADRFSLLYRLLWRLKDEPDLMAVLSDPLVADARLRAKAVGRASHKMKAFVRFRQADRRWVAWFEPAHRVLESTAPFFVRRFTTMDWSILTPDGAAHWDGDRLAFGPPATRDQAPEGDDVEDYWRTYYASTFNPARLRTAAMQSEMPKRYWKNLPEAALIPQLVAGAGGRAREMVARESRTPNARFLKAIAPTAPAPTPLSTPPPADLAELRQQVAGCRRCPLWRDATHGVCGEGASRARLMIVGEQPGDHEDLAGRPFLGPAGSVLDAAMKEAGLDRASVFVTNAVRHFKHEPRGKRRLHRTPDSGEIQSCRWWLDQERRLVKPDVIVALGATAAMSVLGRKVAVTRERGSPLADGSGATIIVSLHPAHLLRLPDPDLQAEARRHLVSDLSLAARLRP
jgi:DNA polymerase